MRRKAQRIEEPVNLYRIFLQKHYKKKEIHKEHIYFIVIIIGHTKRKKERVLITRGFCQLGIQLILGAVRTFRPRTPSASHSHTFVDSPPSFPPPMPKKKKLISSQNSSLKNKNLIQSSLALSFD